MKIRQTYRLPSKLFLNIFIAVFLFALSSCGGGNHPQRGQLVSATELATIPAAAVSQMITAYSSFGLQGLTATYDVVAYKVVYKTPDHTGKLVDASGLVVAPVKGAGGKSPLISMQHGTIFLDVPPSSLKDAVASDPEVSYSDIAIMFASQGYVISAPDYLGYGDTVGTVHPFVHAKTLASTTIDMLRATKKVANTHGVPLNGQVFLSGYSEGGYATLAAQRSMELDFPVELPITASAPAAGPYDMTLTSMAILSAPALPVPSYVGFVLKAYDTVYNLNSISYYFQAPYVDAINTSFNGSLSRAQIDALLTADTATLFNSVFRDSFLNAGEPALSAAFADNDIYDWTPSTITHFYHGVDDVTVPYINTTIAVATMQANGAANVTGIDCDLSGFGLASSHSNCFFPYFSYANGLFATLATDL